MVGVLVHPEQAVVLVHKEQAGVLVLYVVTGAACSLRLMLLLARHAHVSSTTCHLIGEVRTKG